MSASTGRLLLFLIISLEISSFSTSLEEGPTPPLPALLKFHKVAGATIATVLRNACPDQVPPFHWDYKKCPATPHGHGGLALYRRRGRPGLLHCLQHNATSQVLVTTMLRDPVERVLSALHFFYGGRYKRWARSEEQKARSILLASSSSSSSSSFSGDMSDLITEDLLRHLQRESLNHWRQPINEYTAVLGRALSTVSASKNT